MRKQQILLTLAFALTIPAVAGAFSLKDFEVAERFEGKPAEVNFQKGLGGTDPEVLRPVESHIREKAAKGPNLAGNYTVTTYPCGTMCEGFAIVSAVDGSVYVPGFATMTGVLFRRDANYLIVDPIDESNEEEKELKDTYSIETRFYRWDGQKLSEVTSVTPEVIAEAQKTALAQNLNIAHSEAVAAFSQGDYATAFYKVRWAAEGGHAAAQNSLGARYEIGDLVPQDYTEAIKWYRKAADQGDVDAQFNLGRIYEEGNSIPQDYKEAEKWYQRAADQDHPEAGRRLNIVRGKNSEWAQRHINAFLGLREMVDNHPLEHCRRIGPTAEGGIRWVQETMVPAREQFLRTYNLEVPFERAAFKRVEANYEQAINKRFGDLVRWAKDWSCIQ